MHAFKQWIKELLAENAALKLQVQKLKTDNAKLKAMKNIVDSELQYLKKGAEEK